MANSFVLLKGPKIHSLSKTDSYLRYLIRHLQKSFDLHGMPIRIIVKKSATSNPYVKKKGNRSGFGLGGRDARYRRRIAEYRKMKGKVN